ncbi:MAG: hypothetical protein J6Z36_00395, partial [Clostridia bacterium]|nr:hypothetical protein [Clostridia bacterium]
APASKTEEPQKPVSPIEQANGDALLTNNAGKITFDDVLAQAKYDGIRVWTSGGPNQKKDLPEDFFNKGLTLFKSALIFFAFAILECLFVILFKDSIFANLSNSGEIAYISVILSLSFIVPIVCGILYLAKYQPISKRLKNNTAIYNGIVVFIVLLILLVIADLLADVSLTEIHSLLLWLVIPGVYLLNVIVFSVAYYLFSKSKI